MKKSNSLSQLFAKNRAEEMPDDVWGKYVLPFGYKYIDLRKWSKASVIVGGRGSGKTMFLKYHCHSTIFSCSRKKLDISSLQNIGIYWRPDTSFTQHMSEEWLNKQWLGSFITFMTLSILIEFSRLVNNILKSNINNDKLKEKLNNIYLPKMIKKSLKLNKENNIYLRDSEKYFQDALFELINWINNPDEHASPISLNLIQTLSIIINEINLNLDEQSKTSYHIYIDEFENLTTKQQEIINTFMKHGKPPLLFSVAYKKNASVTYKTLSNENIVPRNDYRIIDLEENFIENFKLFSAEVLALRLVNHHLKDDDLEKVIVNYSDETTLVLRQQDEYKKAIKELACSFLPSKSYSDISKEILSDDVLKRKLINWIEDGLKLHKQNKLNPMIFIDDRYPEASIVNGALLNRRTTNTNELLNTFLEYKKNKNEQNSYQSWISNNLVGSILYIYNRISSRICPIYVGFNQFQFMAKGNLRHFIELCYQSIKRAELECISDEDCNLTEIPVKIQAKSTYNTSSLELEKISDLGPNGYQLKKIANRLGTIFQFSQKRKSQSEPEVNHFTFELSDTSQLSKNTQKLLKEALVWSVLFEEKSTKIKSNTSIEPKDYILHPVLSPYFGISYRKKRKLNLALSDLKVIFEGDDNSYSKFLNTLIAKWNNDIDQSNFESNSHVEQLDLYYD